MKERRKFIAKNYSDPVSFYRTKDFVSCFKESIFEFLSCFVFLSLSLIFSPYITAGLPANVGSALNAALKSKVDLSNEGESPIGRLFAASDTPYDYYYYDIPNEKSHIMQYRFQDILTIKGYLSEGNSQITAGFASDSEGGETAALFASRYAFDDSFWKEGFYPGCTFLASANSASLLASDSIYINKSFADGFLDNFGLDPGDYGKIIGRNVYMNVKLRFSGTSHSYCFQVGGVIDPGSLGNTFIPKLCSNYFFIEENTVINACSSLFFETEGMSETERTRYVDKLLNISEYEPGVFTPLCEYRIGFYEYVDGTYSYLSDEEYPNSLNSFMKGCYTVTFGTNRMMLLTTYGLIDAGLIILFAITYFRYIKKTSSCNPKAFFMKTIGHIEIIPNCVLFLFSFVFSVITIAIIDTFTITGSYSVPLFSIPNAVSFLVVFFIDVWIVLICKSIQKKQNKHLKFAPRT